MENDSSRGWLTTEQCAEEYNIKISYLRADRWTKKVGFPYSKIGRLIRYSRQAMDEFFARRGR